MSSLFIMGGSTFYTLQMLQSFHKAGLTDQLTRITLFGRNRDRLALISEAGSTLLDGTVIIDWTTRYEDCLSEEYSLIFNQIRFGGLHARDGDEKLAIQVGLPADETLGIVGASNAVRTIQGMRPFLDVLQTKKGDYRLVNFTNPCSILCQYMAQMLPGKVIGVCDYPAYMRSEIANEYGVETSEVDMRYFGLNHFGVVTDLSINGECILSNVIERSLCFAPECNRYFNSLLNVSWRYVYEAGKLVAEQRAKPNRASALLAFEDSMESLLEQGERDPKPYLEILSKRQCDWYNLAVTPVISALLGDQAESLYVNCMIDDLFQLDLTSTIVEAEFDLVDVANDSLGNLEKRMNLIKMPDDEFLRTPEFTMIRLMKQAEIVLLNGILQECPKQILRACLINPTIREVAKAKDYFRKLGEVDESIARFFGVGNSVSTI